MKQVNVDMAGFHAGLEEMQKISNAMIHGVIQEVGPDVKPELLAAAAMQVLEFAAQALVSQGFPEALVRTLATTTVKHMDMTPAKPDDHLSNRH